MKINWYRRDISKEDLIKLSEKIKNQKVIFVRK